MSADGFPGPSSSIPPKSQVCFVGVGAGKEASFSEEVVRGLSKPEGEKDLPCRFFYDAHGSKLFEKITRLDDYYPTAAELDILERHASDVAQRVGANRPMVELGSGNAKKALRLLPPFCGGATSFDYIPIDISATALEANAEVLADRFRNLRITALVGDYRAGLARLDEFVDSPRSVAWLGGSIGNMSRDDAARFVSTWKSALGAGGSALVGIDLRKDKEVLERAYDDRLGVTAEFNLNLLRRMERELSAVLDVGGFFHVAEYDEDSGRIALFLESRAAQAIRVPGLSFEATLAAGERIHTESSFKYSREEIESLAERAGLALADQWFDAGQRFSLNRFVPA